MTYVRPDESARALLRPDQERPVREGDPASGGRPAAAAELPNLGKLIPTDKLPDFSVFAKYLSLGGGFSVMDDDGFTMTGFTLRRSNP